MRHFGLSILSICCLALATAASAQVTLNSSSIQTTASATTPVCSDLGNGGVGVAMATASCALPFGFTAASSSSASFVASGSGGTLAGAAQTGATADDEPPVLQANSNASSSTLAEWIATTAAHYTVSVSGAPFVNISGTAGSNLPPSGILAATDSLAVALSTSSFSLASVNGPLTDADSESGEAEVTFAAVGATDLLMGTVLAGGTGMAGLEVVARDGGTPIAGTLTAGDGSYLLSGITVPVTLRLSDPNGMFDTEFSPTLMAPATYDADLDPIVSVPLLPGPGFVLLCIGIGLEGARRLRRRFAARA